MPHSFGYRAHSRDLFHKKFRQHGTIKLSKILTPYHLGDIVDIVGDGAVHKGMPHRFYHGKTGVIWNVTPRAVGVELNKQVGNRILKKRIHVRIEHVQHSKCRQDFLNRVKENDKKKKEAKAKKVTVVLKRQPVAPLPARFVKKPFVDTITPLPYVGLFQNTA
eukprot:TRINITY_DN5487_c0_g1_i1.p1 TRINITY_DN5487_c0_g1~~TRINITY_DN5487_c0_g1_i1.p1  ORF type:complete len:163 (-),score=34.63 TRINITY_DN5487_c0_g1_i1:103-591(-)